MSHIKVEFAQLQEVGQTCSNVSGKILQATKDFQESMRGLDWQVKSKSNIESRARKLTQRLEGCRATLRSYSSFSNTAHAKYADLENYQKGLDGLGNITSYSTDTSVSNSVPNDSNKEGKKEFIEWILKKFSAIFSMGKRYKDNENAGVIGDVLGIIATVSELTHELKNSVSKLISKVMKIISKSIPLVYELLKKKNAGNAGIVAAILSTLAELIGVSENGVGKALQNSEGIFAGIGKIAKEVLKKALTGVTEYSKEIVKEVVGKVIEPLAAFGSTCTRFVGDMIEFTKDGNYSIQDFARTLLDSGLSGASSWIKSLTCGFINFKVDQTGDYVMDACNSVHDYMKKNNWPTWAKVAGSIIGAPVTFGIGLGNMFKGKTLTA